MTDRMDTEALQELRKAANEATGDPARYPRRSIIDRYHGAVVAAYEAEHLVPATEVLELRAKVQSLGTEGHAYREGKLAGHRIGFNAGIEAAAKIADDEAARILSKQDGREPMVDQNLRFMALMLPEVAIAIRALKQEASNG